MAYTAFDKLDTCPDLKLEDNNFTVNAYFAKKSAGLDENSTSGWRSPGPLDPGSYEAPLQTTTNETKLGATKVIRSQHVNDQALTLNMGIKGLTPFGMRLKNKNSLDQIATLDASKTSLIAVSTVSLNEFEVTATEGALFAAGDVVQIEIGSGNSAYLDYRRVESVTGDLIRLVKQVDEPFTVGATVNGVIQVEDQVGGSGLQPYSALIVCTGDSFSDQLIQFFPDLRISDGKLTSPDAEVGMTTLTATVFGDCKVIGGRKEVVFGKEILRYAETI